MQKQTLLNVTHVCVYYVHGSLKIIENSIIQIWSNSTESVHAKVQYT